MASVWKHPKSQYWYARFTDADGVQRNRSTKLTKEKEALRLAMEWEDGYRRELTQAQVLKVMSEINERFNGNTLNSQSARDYLTKWATSKKSETSDTTHAKYKKVAAEFVTWLGDNADRPLFRVTTQDITAWRDHAVSKTTAATALTKLKILKTAFKQAHREGVLLDDPAVKVKPPSSRGTVRRRGFSEEEIQSLISHADETWHGIILTGLYTGQRLRDICLLKWSDFDFAKNMVTVFASKTQRHISIPIATPLASWLKPRKKAAGHLFPDHADIAANRMGTGQVSAQFGELMEKAGVIEARPKTKHSRGIGRSGKRQVSDVSFHSLRHTATSMMKEAGVPEAVVMEIIGHESKAVSRVYTHIGEDTKAQALAKLPDITTRKPPRAAEPKSDTTAE